MALINSGVWMKGAKCTHILEVILDKSFVAMMASRKASVNAWQFVSSVWYAGQSEMIVVAIDQ